MEGELTYAVFAGDANLYTHGLVGQHEGNFSALTLRAFGHLGEFRTEMTSELLER